VTKEFIQEQLYRGIIEALPIALMVLDHDLRVVMTNRSLSSFLAIENGEAGIRVNIVHPDGVFEGSGLWREIKKERARSHGVSAAGLEKYYQDRNLMKVRVEARDVAEAVLFFLSQRSAKTTGCMLTVDGGLKEAFPR